MTDVHLDWAQFALLLIDMQCDFWTERMAETFPQFPANVARLLEFCRAEGIEVIHLRASFRPDMSDWMVRYKLRGPIPCIAGTPGVETLPCARDKPGEIVMIKRTFDGFQDPELLRHLRQRGKRFVLTAGLVTSTCVLFTTVSAAQNGLMTAVIEDCCADEPLAHNQTLDRYAFVFERTTLDHLCDCHSRWSSDLQRLAGTRPKA